jgi:alpha-tubulin suppressor-like RCC1 family protein
MIKDILLQVSRSYNPYVPQRELWGTGQTLAGELDGNFNSRKYNLVDTNNNWEIVEPNYQNSVVAIKSDGTLWTWGSNINGFLGDNTTVNRSSPVQIGTRTWVSASSGAYHVSAIRSDGTLWVWGGGTSAELGLGQTSMLRSSPVQLGTHAWKSISNYFWGAIGVRSDDTIWGWGSNANGQLGNGDTAGGFGIIDNVSGSWSVAAPNRSYTIAVKTNGELYGWGLLNTSGQLATNDTTSRSVPVQITNITTWVSASNNTTSVFGITNDGVLWAWGNNTGGILGTGNRNRSRPVFINTNIKFKEVHQGITGVIGISNNGTLWAWGNNSAGQLGLNDVVTRSSPVQVGTRTWNTANMGWSFTMAIRSDGTLWSWGSNSSGQLGLGDTSQRNSPVQVGTETNWLKVDAGTVHVFAIKTDNTLWSWGSNGAGENGQLGQRSSPVQLGTLTWNEARAHYSMSVGIRSDGTLWTWGANFDGQLGLGDTDSRNSPVQVGTETNWYKVMDNTNYATSPFSPFGMALKTDGTLWSWGSNTYGQLGTNDTVKRSSPVQVGTRTDWNFIAGGDYFAVGITTSGSIWSWGRNDQLQLGLGDAVNRSNPVQIGNLSTWVSASLGDAIGVLLDNSGTAYNVGSTSIGADLGIGNRSHPIIVGPETNWKNASFGANQAVAVKTNGTLWTWGGTNTYSYSGELATNNFELRQMDNQINWVSASFFGDPRQVMTLKTDGTMWMWGANASGQLGFNDTVTRSSPVQLGTLTWKKIASGGTAFSSAIRNDDTLWTWGNGGNSSLGLGTTANRSSPVQVGTLTWNNAYAGLAHMIAIRTDGTLWGWGINGNGQLGQNNVTDRPSPVQIGTDTNWSKAAAGGRSSFGIKTDGTLWSWGRGTSGELGISAASDRSSPVQIGTLTWNDVYVNDVSTFAIRTDGTLWSWGGNFIGQLGDGSLINRSSPVQVGTRTDWRYAFPGNNTGNSVGITNDNNLWAWGRVILRNNTVENNVTSPVQIGVGISWQSVANSGDGSSTMYAITTDNRMYTGPGTVSLYSIWGGNTQRSSPVQIGTETNWAYASAGDSRSFGIKNDGTLWGWGSGALGFPYLNTSNIQVVDSPVQIGTNTWRSFALGLSNANFSGIQTDGTLWSWGNNDVGQLGDNTSVSKSSPVQLGTLSNWSNISAGNQYFLAVKNDGTLWGWGRNQFSQLGLANTIARSSPTQIGNETDWYSIFAGDTHSAGIRTRWNNDLYTAGVGTSYNANYTTINGWGSSRRSPILLSQSNPWITINCGGDHNMAIRNDGTIWGWGSNQFGQVGSGTTDANGRSSPVQIGTMTWKSIDPIGANTLGIRSDNTLWSWGWNVNGQLGLGDAVNRSSPVQVGTRLWLSAKPGVWYSARAIRDDGTLWVWGTSAALGLNESSINRSSPVQIGTETDWLYLHGNYSDDAATFVGKTNKSLYVSTNGIERVVAGISFLKTSPVQVTSVKNWKSIHSGTSFTIAISNNGSIWGWGNRSNGALGDNIVLPQFQESPVQIGTLTTWVSASAGDSHIAAVRTDGTIWTWGLNTSGQLGLNDSSNRSSPVQVGTLTNWKDISSGRAYTMAIKTDGTLWGWGLNTNNQIGNATGISTQSPVQVGTRTWNVISAGVLHTAAIRSDGTLWAWGDGTSGQLGQGNVTNFNSPVQVGTLTGWQDVAVGPSMTMAIRNGTLWSWGLNTSGQLGLLRDRSRPNYVVPNTTFTNVSAGTTYFVGIAPNQTLWGWGTNTSGQLGLNDTTNRSSAVQLGTRTWNKISAGGSTGASIAISTDGSIWSWGSSADAMLGIFQFNPQYISGSNVWNDVKVGYAFSPFAILKLSDNTLWGIGDNVNGILGIGTSGAINSTTSPVQIGTSTWNKYHTGATGTTLAIRSDGTLWGWGVNNVGQLGLNNTINRSSPVQVGTRSDWTDVSTPFHTLAVRSDGTLWAWGQNGSGELGLSLQTFIQRSSPVQVGTDTNWSKVYSHQSISHAIKTDGTLWAWGLNTGGQLGIGDIVNRSSPVQVGTDTNWSLIAESDGYTNHILAIKTDGTLWSWGQNGSGQLGLNLDSTAHRSSPVQIGTLNNWVSAKVSRSNSMVIKSDGTSWAWGLNSFAELGFSDGIARSSPVQVGTLNTWVSSSISRFSALLENNGNLYTVGTNQTDFEIYTVARSRPIKIGNDTNWKEVEAGANHVVSVKTDGTLWTWGNNTSAGQLGLNDTVNRSSPVQIGTQTNWLNAVASNIYTVALKTDGTMWSWGNNNLGQLGDGTSILRSSPVQIGTRTWGFIASMQGASSTRHTLAIRSDGTLWGWGFNASGQLGLAINMTIPRTVNTSVKFVDAKIAQQHGIAISTDGTLWMWGGTSFNQYNPQSISSPVQIGTRTWSRVAAQQTHSGAIRSDGTLWLWGTGTSGQLGQDNTTSFNSPVQVGTRNDWSSIKVGRLHSMAIRNDRTLWGWGSAQLGDNITVARSSPVQIGTETNWSYVSPGNDTTFALKEDGTLWAWGLNTSGQLGLNDRVNRSSPVQIGTETNWAKIADIYEYHAFAIKTDGTLWSWGINSSGQLGHNDRIVRSSPVQVGTRSDWKTVACGTDNTMAIRNDGTLWSWGTNFNGQLGVGDNIERLSPVQVGTLNTWVSASFGPQNTVLLLNDGTAITTGTGTQAEGFDTGFTVTRSSPVQIGTLNNWVGAFVGDDISMAIRSDRTLWVWGVNTNAQLGVGDAINRSSPVQIGTPISNWASASITTNNVVVLNTDGYALTIGAQVTGYDTNFTVNRSSPIQIGIGTNWQKIKASVANYTTPANSGQFIAQKTDGTLWTWGSNVFGNLGDGTLITRSSPVQIGNETTWVDFSVKGFHFIGIKEY